MVPLPELSLILWIYIVEVEEEWQVSLHENYLGAGFHYERSILIFGFSEMHENTWTLMNTNLILLILQIQIFLQVHSAFSWQQMLPAKSNIMYADLQHTEWTLIWGPHVTTEQLLIWHPGPYNCIFFSPSRYPNHHSGNSSWNNWRGWVWP